MTGARGRDDDLPLKADVASAATSFRVAGTETAVAYDDDTVFKAVAVILNTGASLFLGVNSITQDCGDSVVHLADAFPHAVAVEDVVMISWMPVWRFASDGMSIDWLTDAVTRFQLSLLTLEDLDPE